MDVLLQAVHNFWYSSYGTAAAVVVLSVSIYWLAVTLDSLLQRKAMQQLDDLREECTQHMDVEPVFKNLPNFRQAGGKGLRNKHGKKIKNGQLFRSSRTDFLTENEKRTFHELGIKTIIDLRRTKEYEKAEGEKLLDESYEPYILKKGQAKEWVPPRWSKAARKRKTTATTTATDSVDETDGERRGRRRYLVNLMTMDLIWYVFSQVNFFIRYISLILALVDWLFGVHLFVRFFNWLVVNNQTLSKQYFDILEYTKPAVSDILRLIIEGDNVPVLVHCAHGKDRTGVIIAVILGCLEVDDEVIAQDYAESEAGLAPIRERLYRETVGRYGFKKEFTKADAVTMREVLKEVNKKYGSMSAYLLSAGFTLDEQQKLKSIFLEDSSESQSETESEN